MNRTQEIRRTLSQAEQADPSPDDRWLATYRDHITYLLNVIEDTVGNFDLHDRLRDQSRQIAALTGQLTTLTRQVRRQRWVIGTLTFALVLGALIGLATVHSEAAPRPTKAPGPILELLPVSHDQGGGSIADGTFGTFCTPWEPTGEHCAGGCLWRRACTDCMGCDWYWETECRPSPGANCPFYGVSKLSGEVGIDGDHGAEATGNGTATSEGP